MNNKLNALNKTPTEIWPLDIITGTAATIDDGVQYLAIKLVCATNVQKEQL